MTNTGLLHTVTDNLGGVIEYFYNSANQVIKINSVGSLTTFEYDKYGRQKTITEPNTGVTTYNYNGLSQITSQTDTKGNLYAFNYDKLGRVLTKSETASGSSTPVVTNYSYDTETNGKGAISSITGGANGFSTSYKYDALSRNYKVIENNGGKVLTVTNEYDELGRITKVIYPSKDNVEGGFYVNYIYDETFGHLYKITDTSDNTIWELESRNVNGSCKEVKLGPDGIIVKTTTFTPNGTPDVGKMNYTGTNPWENKWTYVFNASTLNLDSRKNTLTVNGSITRNLTETFEYDNLDRLWKTYKNSGQGAVLTQEMNYSGNGNIEDKTDVGSYQYDAGPHVASGIQNSPTPLTLQEITYTPFNKMKTVIIDDQASLKLYKHSLTYGFDNERRISVDQSSPDPNHFEDIRTKYYSQNYELIIKGTTKKELHYITAPDGLAAIYEIKDGVGTMYYTQTDYQGSLMMVVKEDGTRVNDLSYDAWGNRRDPNSWKLKTSVDLIKELSLAKLITDRGYTLHEHLDVYGLINMNGRAYDQRLAQFLSPDPFVQAPENTQSYNRYAYCYNNPFKYTDPSGNTIIGTILTAVIDFFDKGFSGGFDLTNPQRMKSQWREYDPTASWSKTNKAFKIDMGMFASDNKKNFVQQAWQIASRFTPWEGIQTILGNVRSHYFNISGKVESVNYFHGATILDVEKSVTNTGQNLGGSYILMNSYLGICYDEYDDLIKHSETLMHEYGHYLQSRMYGPIGYLISSINSAAFSKERRDDNAWSERDASNQGYSYFLNEGYSMKGWKDKWDNQNIGYLGLISGCFLPSYFIANLIIGH